MNELKSNITPVVALIPVAHTATKADAPILDLQGSTNHTVVINTGAIAASGDYTITLRHGDDSALSGDAVVAAAEMLGELPASLAADSVYHVGYIGEKRYLRVVITKNSGTSIVAGAVLVKQSDLRGTV